MRKINLNPDFCQKVKNLMLLLIFSFLYLRLPGYFISISVEVIENLESMIRGLDSLGDDMW